MLTLYGSTTSPYVRRLRMFLFHDDFDFINWEIYSGDDRDKLFELNPTAKIPMLKDDDAMMFDSRVIFRYLSDKFAYPSLSWEQENLLTTIDACNDSFVQMMLLKRSDIDVSEDKLYYNLQRERVAACLSELDKLAEAGYFNDWNYLAISLYSLIDWVEFRSLHGLQGLDALKEFQQRHHDRIEVTATDPRS